MLIDTFTENNLVIDSKEIVQGTNYFVCKPCDQSFRLESDMIRHKQMHKHIIEPTCGKGFKPFKQMRHLKRHMITQHTKSRSEKCPRCNKIVKDLKRHMRHMHIEEKKHKCNQCDKSYPHLISLKGHQLYNHSTSTQYKCILCDKSFINNSILTCGCRAGCH